MKNSKRRLKNGTLLDSLFSSCKTRAISWYDKFRITIYATIPFLRPRYLPYSKMFDTKSFIEVSNTVNSFVARYIPSDIRLIKYILLTEKKTFKNFSALIFQPFERRIIVEIST